MSFILPLRFLFILAMGTGMALFLPILLVFFPVISFASENMLEVLDQKNHVVLTKSIDPECGFIIQYTHSVALTPVKDFFSTEDGEIFLEKTEYQDFGAGLPFNPAENQKMEFTGKKIVLDIIHHKVSPFTLRIGRVAKHQLIFLYPNKENICEEQEKIPLENLDKPGSPLTFKMKKPDEKEEKE